MENITNLIRIKSNSKLNMTPEGDFFRAWVEFLKPIHNLTKREMDVLALFLKERYELSKVITDSDVLNSVLMSETTKRKVREKCGISVKHFQVVMSKFRKNGVLVDNKIYLTLIPSMSQEGAGLMIYFTFEDEQRFKFSN